MADGGYVPRGFHITDYVIFGATVVMSSAIGVYFACTGGKQKTNTEYLLGDRKQKIAPVALSLVVSFESSVMILGFAAEMYAYGTHYWMSMIGYLFCCVIVSQTFVPLFYPLEMTSSYEYLDLRFKSRSVRLLASVFGIMSYLWYMGLVLFGPAMSLEAVTGFPVSYSIIIVTVAAVFYTTIGGIKAVIWSDTLQCLIMLAGMLAVVITGAVAVGGPGKVLDYCERGGRMKFYDFDPDPRTRLTFWNLIVVGSVRHLNLGINQSTVQRISSMESLRAAKIVMLLTFPGFLIFASLACIQGLTAYAYFYDTRCDPLGADYLQNANQILLFFVMELFRKQPGLPGLFLAALVSASLSTLSSGFCSVSANLWSDFLKPCFPTVSETKATMITKATVLLIGLVTIGVSYLVMQIGGPLTQVLWIVRGAIDGPLTGLFLLGGLFPSSTAKGAISGAAIAFALVMWVAMGATSSPLAVKTPYLSPAPTDRCYIYSSNTSAAAMTSQSVLSSSGYSASTEIGNTSDSSDQMPLTTGESILSYLYSLSYLWYSPVSMLITIFLGLAISHATGPNLPGTVDPKYIIPVFDNLFCYLPKSVRENLRYGKDFVPDSDEDDRVMESGDKNFVLSVLEPMHIPHDVVKDDDLMISDKLLTSKEEVAMKHGISLT